MTISESSPRAGDLFPDGSSPAPPKLDLSGARSHFYRSPQTPSAASSLCRSITPNQSSSRKRARYGYDDDAGDHKGLRNKGSLDDRSGGIWGDQSSTLFSGMASPAPLVDTQYRLAGGSEPSRAASLQTAFSRYDGLNNDNGGGPEADYRPSRYSATSTDTNSRKRSRRHSTPASDNVCAEKPRTDDDTERNWGKAVLSLVGDVAGKVWDFCWSGSFRGFYAGGGQGYEIDNAGTSYSSSSGDSQLPGNHECSCGKNGAHISSPSAQCQQHNGHVDRDDLRNNWILVKPDDAASVQPTRKTPHRNSVVQHAASRRTPTRPTVSKRVNVSTPTRPSPYRHQQSSSQGSAKPEKPESPLSVETQRHTAKIRKQEREEDASIRRLNDQLKSMIREGKEALGTQVEVEGMDFGDSD